MHADVLIRGTSHLAVDYGRFHFHAEVGGDVKVGQLCVYVCVDNGQQVYTDKSQIMFINCDRSLLEYDFYRKSESVFSLFKERLKSLILLNLFPILILGIFIDVIFKIYLGMNFLELIYVLIILISSSIIFTLYHLSIYYLVQPYDRESKIKDMRLVVSNLLVSVILLMISRVKVSLYLLTFVMVVVTMIYLLIILYLIKRKSFKTFKLH